MEVNEKADETDVDFGFGFDDGRSALRQVGEVVGWSAIMVGFALATALLTPPQRSAEADLFEAQMSGEAP